MGKELSIHMVKIDELGKDATKTHIESFIQSILIIA